MTATALPNVFSRYRSDVRAGLKAVFPDSTTPLYGMLRYHLGWQDEQGLPADANVGKEVRPALCLFACEAVGGTKEQALPPAVAIELIHNFSLIHDDIQDGDTERRHRKTVWYIWGQSHGINAGDAMHALGNLALLDTNPAALPPERRLEISRILTRASLEMIEGQVLDLTFEGRPSVKVDDYLTMIGKKTGALLEASLHMGAVAAAADPATVEAMRLFGKGLGLLFQVRDDMLGIWGAQDKTGKPAASDIHRRKKSLPIVHALQHAEGAARDRMLAIYRSDRPLNEGDVHDVLAVLDEVRAAAYCTGLAREHAERSMATLAPVHLSASARAECADLVQFLMDREH